MSAPTNHPGVVLLGGAHGALALARSFGRRGIPVTLVSDDHPLPRFSRFVTRHSGWPGPGANDAASWLIGFAGQQGCNGWLLIPCGDNELRLVANHLERLRQSYRIISSPWDSLRRVCDKQQLAQTAAASGIAVPRAYQAGSDAEAAALAVQYPVVLKPAMRTERNAFTQAKAWRADDRDQLLARYRAAAALVGDENVVVQEMIPGGGETQFSYAGVWREGKPVADLTARRTRQYPIDFSYTSTFVEIVANEDVRAAATTLLGAIDFEGLVEVEFKFDARDRSYKVLDVNTRAWSWLALCEASGANFGHVLHALATSAPIPATPAAPGHAWIHTVRDAAAALHLIARGDLTFADYLHSLRRRLTFASFAWDDPTPGLIELPLTAWRVLARKMPSLARRSRPGASATPAAPAIRPPEP
jgi:predicted ATP-grasp superfamily ATP-dependent carboligase